MIVQVKDIFFYILYILNQTLLKGPLRKIHLSLCRHLKSSPDCTMFLLFALCCDLNDLVQ